MKLADLDVMAQLIAGVNFSALGPDHRARIVELALQSRIAFALEDIMVNFQLASEALTGTDQTYGLHDIGASLHEVGRWYEKSKLFDGV